MRARKQMTAVAIGCLFLVPPIAPSQARSHSSLAAKAGVLKVRVVGLPSGRAVVRIRGPRFAKKLRIGGKRILRLRPGVYRVRAAKVVVAGASYVPERRRVRLRVGKNARVRVVVRYTPAAATPPAPVTPTVAPAAPAPPGLISEVLARINRARAEGVRCDGSIGPPLAAISYSAELGNLARWHAEDLAAGRDNDFLADLRRSGFPGAFVGESGVRCPKVADADGVLQAMREWDRTCEHLFDPDVDRIGIAYVGNAGSDNTWVLTFGRSS